MPRYDYDINGLSTLSNTLSQLQDSKRTTNSWVTAHNSVYQNTKFSVSGTNLNTTTVFGNVGGANPLLSQAARQNIRVGEEIVENTAWNVATSHSFRDSDAARGYNQTKMLMRAVGITGAANVMGREGAQAQLRDMIFSGSKESNDVAKIVASDRFTGTGMAGPLPQTSTDYNFGAMSGSGFLGRGQKQIVFDKQNIGGNTDIGSLFNQNLTSITTSLGKRGINIRSLGTGEINEIINRGTLHGNAVSSDIVSLVTEYNKYRNSQGLLRQAGRGGFSLRATTVNVGRNVMSTAAQGSDAEQGYRFTKASYTGTKWAVKGVVHSTKWAVSGAMAGGAMAARAARGVYAAGAYGRGSAQYNTAIAQANKIRDARMTSAANVATKGYFRGAIGNRVRVIGKRLTSAMGHTRVGRAVGGVARFVSRPFRAINVRRLAMKRAISIVRTRVSQNLAFRAVTFLPVGIFKGVGAIQRLINNIKRRIILGAVGGCLGLVVFLAVLYIPFMALENIVPTLASKDEYEDDNYDAEETPFQKFINFFYGTSTDPGLQLGYENNIVNFKIENPDADELKKQVLGLPKTTDSEHTWTLKETVENPGFTAGEDSHGNDKLNFLVSDHVAFYEEDHPDYLQSKDSSAPATANNAGIIGYDLSQYYGSGYSFPYIFELEYYDEETGQTETETITLYGSFGLVGDVNFALDVLSGSNLTATMDGDPYTWQDGKEITGCISPDAPIYTGTEGLWNRIKDGADGTVHDNADNITTETFYRGCRYTSYEPESWHPDNQNVYVFKYGYPSQATWFAGDAYENNDKHGTKYKEMETNVGIEVTSRTFRDDGEEDGYDARTFYKAMGAMALAFCGDDGTGDGAGENYQFMCNYMKPMFDKVIDNSYVNFVGARYVEGGNADLVAYWSDGTEVSDEDKYINLYLPVITRNGVQIFGASDKVKASNQSKAPNISLSIYYLGTGLQDLIATDTTDDEWAHTHGSTGSYAEPYQSDYEVSEDSDDATNGVGTYVFWPGWWNEDGTPNQYQLDAINYYEMDDDSFDIIFEDIHLPGDLAHKLTEAEINEILSQIAPYCTEHGIEIIEKALEEVGCHEYKYGAGHGSFEPDGTHIGGLDCSGFVSLVLHKCGLIDTPMSCSALLAKYSSSKKNFNGDFSSLTPGTIIISNDKAGGKTTSSNHVVIYIGTFKFDGDDAPRPYCVECTRGRGANGETISGVQLSSVYRMNTIAKYHYTINPFY